MTQYITAVESWSSCGIQIVPARRFTDAEKARYAEWYRDYGFARSGDVIYLDNVIWRDLYEVIDDRKADGAFPGTDNHAWIITEDEKAALIALNQQRAAEKAAQERADRIEQLSRIITRCEAQGKLYTKEEAAKERKQYNDFYNEGGEGFVPHFYTIDDYQWAKRELAEIRGENGNDNP